MTSSIRTFYPFPHLRFWQRFRTIDTNQTPKVFDNPMMYCRSVIFQMIFCEIVTKLVPYQLWQQPLTTVNNQSLCPAGTDRGQPYTAETTPGLSLRKINAKKAAGSDWVTGRILWDSTDQLPEVYTIFFNLWLQEPVLHEVCHKSTSAKKEHSELLQWLQASCFHTNNHYR